MIIIIIGDIDKVKSIAIDEIEVVMDEFVRKPKKIQTNSLYGELRGKTNGKQK